VADVSGNATDRVTHFAKVKGVTPMATALAQAGIDIWLRRVVQ